MSSNQAVTANFTANPTATTSAATGIGTKKATLNGSVNPGGQAVTWQFQYGVSKSYNKGTPVQNIAAGKTSPQAVSWGLIRLSPNTLYHFRLAVTYSSGGAQRTVYGQDLTFTTKPTGKLLLPAKRLKVVGGFVLVPLRCQSRLKCVSQFTITTATKVKRKKATVVCAVKVAKLKPGQRKTVRAKLRKACLALLRKAHGHRLKAKFTTRPRTGQSGVIRRVVLTL
jgi:hypothetical protein